MSIIGIVLVLLVVGFLFWIIQTAPIPISPWFKTVIMGVIAIGLLIWLLQVFGFHTGLNLHL